MKKLDDDFWSESYFKKSTGWDFGKISVSIKEYVNQIENWNSSILFLKWIEIYAILSILLKPLWCLKGLLVRALIRNKMPPANSPKELMMAIQANIE